MVSFDSGDFNRQLKGSMESAANEGMAHVASELQRIFDSVIETDGGRPVEQVKAALRSACSRSEFTLDDVQLTAYATAISEGTRVVVEPERIRL
jgi:hypothetical protein